MINLLENVFCFIFDVVLVLFCFLFIGIVCLFFLGLCTLTCFLWCCRIYDGCNRVNDRVIDKFLEMEEWMAINIFHKEYNKQQ